MESSEPATVTSYHEATAYTVMKWPSLAAHSQASLADALATVTPVLTRPDARDRSDPRELRTVLYQHTFNPARPVEPGAQPRRFWTGRSKRRCPSAASASRRCCVPRWRRSRFRLDGSRAADFLVAEGVVDDISHDFYRMSAAAAILEGMPDPRDLRRLDTGGETVIFAGSAELFRSLRTTRRCGTWRRRCCGS